MPAISVFDIFKIGIGPSSSHTVGPMKAAAAFADLLEPVAQDVARISISLHGSLAYTGKGHGTDSAVVLGLMGMQPDSIDPDAVEGMLRRVHAEKTIDVPIVGTIPFDPDSDLVFDYNEELPRHTNGMRYVATTDAGDVLLDEAFYSLGGGFIARGDEPEPVSRGRTAASVYIGRVIAGDVESNGLIHSRTDARKRDVVAGRG